MLLKSHQHILTFISESATRGKPGPIFKEEKILLLNRTVPPMLEEEHNVGKKGEPPSLNKNLIFVKNKFPPSLKNGEIDERLIEIPDELTCRDPSLKFQKIGKKNNNNNNNN
jgi:hypothetical protein